MATAWQHPATIALAALILGGTVWAVGAFDPGLAWVYAALVLAGIVLTQPGIVDSFAAWVGGVLGGA